MTQYSYSRVDLWHRCPYHYKLKYIDRLHEMQKLDADNPLIVGSALHKGIEAGEKAMEQLYFDSFPVITEEQENEMMKLRAMLPKVQKYLAQFEGCRIEHEVQINGPDFIGYADLIITAPDGTSMVMDFKYSNSVENYKKSGQLHLYKYYLDHAGYDVTGLKFLFIHKTSIRQKKTEDLYEFRKRLKSTLDDMEIETVDIPYDEMNVVYFKNAIKEIETAMTAWRTAPKGKGLWADSALQTLFPKNPDDNCFACKPRFAPEYIDALQNVKFKDVPIYYFHDEPVYIGGKPINYESIKTQTNKEINLMPIPKNERRAKTADLKPDTWLYADSYVGKTVFWDSFPDVLMLNTDGNTDNTTSPVDFIKDAVTKTGRMTQRKFAWEQFLDDVQELEAGNTNGFKTVVLDLVEDLYEFCRQYVLHKNGWEHEADGAYGKGWSAVTGEFHNAIKRLKAVGLQVVYISREDRKDVTLKNGITRTTFQPNISAKVANFLTGTVDITMRAYVNDSDKHVLQLQKAPQIFGGGRYEFKVAEVPLERQAFLDALADAQPVGSDRDANAKVVTATFEEPAPEAEEEAPVAAEKPKRRARKTRKAEPEPQPESESESEPEDDVTPPGEGETTPEPAPAPKRRTRKTRAKKEAEAEVSAEPAAETDEQAELKAEAETTPGNAEEPVAEPAKPVRRRRRRRTTEVE